MPRSSPILLALLALVCLEAGRPIECGIIKDIYQKVTRTNNKTEELVSQSVPICGSGAFSTPDENSLSPQIIFITDQTSSVLDGSGARRPAGKLAEVAREFSLHADNVSLAELERRGFDRRAPVTFLIHGFTSGYPLQAWISAMVEAYTIDRARGPAHKQNVFVVNWNYAARGILYPRAVANIPIVASYLTRFINRKLLEEARVDSARIQLIGHSLGAHLAGFVGKNTREPLGRIYGLDPAGPCFGALSGPLFPSERRLGPNDAREVISLHTNSALLGSDKPLGSVAVFVEGGATQPGCGTQGGLLKSLQTLAWDGADFDALACSHSRAPNLLTYRHEQGDPDDGCQLVAYACKDWDSFRAGHCADCSHSRACKLIGLQWQYYDDGNQAGQSSERRRPESGGERNSNRTSGQVEPVQMFLRTGDTQPYCVFHYQIVLELNEPFASKSKPPISLIMQDSERRASDSRKPTSGAKQNTLTSDQFGNKLDERTYTHLLTSNRKLGKIDHATLIMRDGLQGGQRVLKALQVNYMSHMDAQVRRRLSSRLCPVSTDTERQIDHSNTRFFFEPCDSADSLVGSSSSGGHENQRPVQDNWQGQSNGDSNQSNYGNNSHSSGWKQDEQNAHSHLNGGQSNSFQSATNTHDQLDILNASDLFKHIHQNNTGNYNQQTGGHQQRPSNGNQNGRHNEQREQHSQRDNYHGQGNNHKSDTH